MITAGVVIGALSIVAGAGLLVSAPPLGRSGASRTDGKLPSGALTTLNAAIGCCLVAAGVAWLVVTA